MYQNTKYYLVGEVISKALPFLLLPYLTNKLGVSAYGTLAYYLSISVILVVFVSYVQESAVVRYGLRYKGYGERILSVVGVAYSSLVSLLFVVGFLFFDDIGLVLASLLAFTQVIFRLKLCRLQYKEYPKQYVTLQVVQSTLAVVLTVFCFEVFDIVSFEGRISALILSFFASLLMPSKGVKPIRKVNLTKSRIKLYSLYIIGFCSPLIVIHLSNYIKGQFDRVYLTDIYSSNEVGVYSLAYQIASVFLILITSFLRSIQPSIFRMIKNGDMSNVGVRNYSYKMATMSLVVPLIAIVVPESMYLLVFGDDFINVKWLSLLFLLSFSLQVSFLIQTMYLSYYSRTKLVMVIGVFSTLVYMMFLFLLSRISIMYAPLATVISNGFSLIFVSVVLSRENSHEK